MCVRGVDFAFVSTIYQLDLDLGTVLAFFFSPFYYETNKHLIFLLQLL